MIRLLLALSILCGFCKEVEAYPCWMIKAAYAPFKKHGLAEAERWARAQGYSETEIREARKCLR